MLVDEYHIEASSIRPAKRKKSPRTLNNLPAFDETPMVL